MQRFSKACIKSVSAVAPSGQLASIRSARSCCSSQGLEVLPSRFTWVVLVGKRVGAGAMEAEHRTCQHRPDLGVSDAVVLVEALAVVSLPTLTVTARSAFDEDRAVIARQVCRANFGQVCQHFADVSPDEFHRFLPF